MTVSPVTKKNNFTVPVTKDQRFRRPGSQNFNTRDLSSVCICA